jgi:hypothetical protein
MTDTMEQLPMTELTAGELDAVAGGHRTRLPQDSSRSVLPLARSRCQRSTITR